MCSADHVCPSIIGDALARSDGDHLTGTFSARLSTLVSHEVEAALVDG